MLLNPWKSKRLGKVLLDRIKELTAEVSDLKAELDWERDCVRNSKSLVETYKNSLVVIEAANKKLDDARVRLNQKLTAVILQSNLADQFSVTDLSMLDE
jgi:hypothetical protein